MRCTSLSRSLNLDNPQDPGQLLALGEVGGAFTLHQHCMLSYLRNCNVRAGQHQQVLHQQQVLLMQRLLSSGMAGPSGHERQGLVNNNLQPMYTGQLHGRPLGTMSHGQALVPSHGQALVPNGSQAYLGLPSEVENVLKDAHEAYRKGEFMQALQLCHAVCIHLS